MTSDDLIAAVRDALHPGADPATRERAAVVLRGLLAVVDPSAPTPSPASPTPSSAPDAGSTGRETASPDRLALFIDHIAKHLPPGVLDGSVGVRLNIPFMPTILWVSSK
jgi:hypothetical protein